MKTNAMRILERAGVPFETRAYEVDESDLSAITVAHKVGLDPRQVFKTLVTRSGRDVFLAVIPGDAALDLKALARATGARKVEMVPLKEVQALTGYIRGGVTALGTKKPYPVWVDRSIEAWPVVAVSAGTRGLQLLVAPADYLKATGGQLAELATGGGAEPA
ncbi:MAG: Cys-tRNA(Pro) deacylase [Myxococcales bacterium]|nr:Cys-tRNA(Pro) deacylase [Myxococcales bacterium]MCB9646247.1 Cys-tRNA(Pro) deacylase [Deltaproteobacteria bacterium]